MCSLNANEQIQKSLDGLSQTLHTDGRVCQLLSGVT